MGQLVKKLLPPLSSIRMQISIPIRYFFLLVSQHFAVTDFMRPTGTSRSVQLGPVKVLPRSSTRKFSATEVPGTRLTRPEITTRAKMLRSVAKKNGNVQHGSEGGPHPGTTRFILSSMVFNDFFRFYGNVTHFKIQFLGNHVTSEELLFICCRHHFYHHFRRRTTLWKSYKKCKKRAEK
jgi:hypothetical protein